VDEGDLASVSIKGNDLKHIRVEFVDRKRKIEVLRAVKNIKPNNVFLSDYLTRTRANLFFRLRQMKRDNKINAVFVRNGNILCRIDGSTKVEVVNNEGDFNSLNRRI